MTFSEQLQKIGACEEEVKWAEGKTIEQAWKKCERSDWMMWMFEKKISTEGWPDKKTLVLLACKFARRSVKKYWIDKKDKRPIEAIEAAEAWTENQTARAAGAAAWAAGAAARAAGAAARADAGAAARAAGAAARAAWDAARADAGAAARATGAAARAAWDAARADAGAAGAAAQKKELIAQCKIIRAIVKMPKWDE